MKSTVNTQAPSSDVPSFVFCNVCAQPTLAAVWTIGLFGRTATTTLAVCEACEESLLEEVNAEEVSPFDAEELPCAGCGEVFPERLLEYGFCDTCHRTAERERADQMAEYWAMVR